MHKRFFTEPKGSPDNALQFAVAFEKGLKRQVSYVEFNLETKSETVSVRAITNAGKICLRGGAHNFTPQHISQCKAAEEKYGKSGITEKLVRSYGKFKNQGR